ncbi:MAG: hypothetical protein KDN22_28005, partial [Verrucomicrobiae bacterium]|nr:hypothetical protein [Verrucomicrobiae bacterium]
MRLSILDELEHSKLLEAVESAEKLLQGGGSGATLLGDFVRNARLRMDKLEQDGMMSLGSADKKKHHADSENLAVAYYVRQEARLSA